MKNKFVFLSILFCIFFVSYIQAKEYIQTSSGKVSFKYKNKVKIWEDIPFAQPPLNQLRWKAPKDLINKNQIIKSKDNNHCIQRPSSLGGVEGENFYTGSEDCLYLDIFTPKDSSEKLPVMLWIHGGGNTSGLKDIYDFSKMVSKHDVIVVRINYRLGPFGWFTHPAIQDYQNGNDKTSNFGTLDIIKALEWVNINIKQFGGDPNNITIFGESAGGHNVLSLLVSKQARGLFHKAISMSGYTTSISTSNAYKPLKESSTSTYASSNVVEKILKEQNINEQDIKQIRETLLNLSAEEFFNYYSSRESYEELPLLTSDGIVIPEIGLKNALSKKEYVYNVPTIAGSNRDEVKLWLSTARYFVDLDYSFIGSILNIPKVKLKDEDAFEAFNYFRSSAWQIRGVDIPLRSLYKAGNKDLFAYRYDWDDHRRLIIADFKKIIGAAHATEIPLLAGNSDLVGGYPLSDLIYPPSFSKRYLSKNMMKYWSNFAKKGTPGKSSNAILWEPYFSNDESYSYLILDKKRNLKIVKRNITFESLSEELIDDNNVSEIEKCVIFLQMFTFVGNDLYQENLNKIPDYCSRESSEQFLIDNASFIEY